MVEYTVDTLVHLYDSLNGQILDVREDLLSFDRAALNPRLADRYREELDNSHTKLNGRLERLMEMRDKVETLLNKILEAEVNE